MIVAAVAMLAAGAARAQAPAEPPPLPSPEVAQALPPSGFGLELMLGVGITNFTEEAARAITDAGGAWAVRVAFGTRLVLGGEAAYVGSLQDLDVAGLDPEAYLVGNGLEAALRVNAPLIYKNWLFAPFALLGAGWTRYDVVNGTFDSSAIEDDDNLVTVPVGGGISASYEGFKFDGRFIYRPAFEDDLFGSADLHSWTVSLNLGREL